MENPRRHNDENIIREAVEWELKGMEEAPSPEAWEKISSRLDFNDSPRKGKKKFLPRYRSLGFAAAVLLLIGIGGLLFNQMFTPLAQEDMSGMPESEEMTDEEEFGILSDPLTDEAEVYEEDSAMMPEADYIPDSLNGYRSGQVKEISDPFHAVFHLYEHDEHEDKAIWLVRAGKIDEFAGNFPGPDERFIPSDNFTNINRNTFNFATDNTGKLVIFWFYNDSLFMLWAKSDDIRHRDLIRLRSNLP